MPDWSAVIVQVPAARRLTLPPEIPHAKGVSDANSTGKPELADADNAGHAPP